MKLLLLKVFTLNHFLKVFIQNFINNNIYKNKI